MNYQSKRFLIGITILAIGIYTAIILYAYIALGVFLIWASIYYTLIAKGESK